MDDKQLEKEIEVLAESRAKLTKGMATSDEVAQLFTIVLDTILAIKNAFSQEMANNKDEDIKEKKELQQDLMSEMSDMESRMKEMCQEMEDKEAVDIEQVRTQLSKDIKSIQALIPDIPSLDPLWQKLSEIESKIPLIPEKDTPLETRNNLESIVIEEEKLSIKAIGFLQEKLDQLSDLIKNKSGVVRAGGGLNPLVVKGSGLVVDKNTRIIDFVGTGLTSVVRSKDGIVTVTLNGGGGGGSTNVATEKLTPTTSGSDITLNLALLSHTFVTIQWVSKNGQVLDPSDGSFGWIRVSNTITVLNAGDADVFLVHYTY